MFGIGTAELPIVLFIILGFLWLWSVVDILKSDFKGNNKLIWLLVVLFVPGLGAILYLFIGRSQKLT